MDYFVTNKDLLAIFKNCKIIKYADLDNYNDIYMLLPNRMDFCFILTESELNSGHWTLLIRDDVFLNIMIHMVFPLKIY
jgi:hypothetical protein